MTKKIKLERKTDFDFQNVQIESCANTLTSIQKRLEIMQKRLSNLELQYRYLNNEQSCKINKHKVKK